MRKKRKLPEDRIPCEGGPLDGLSVSQKFSQRTEPFATETDKSGRYFYEGRLETRKYVWRENAA